MKVGNSKVYWQLMQKNPFEQYQREDDIAYGQVECMQYQFLDYSGTGEQNSLALKDELEDWGLDLL